MANQSRPDRSVSKENSPNIAEAFEGLSSDVRALTEVIRQQVHTTQVGLEQAARYSAPGAQRTQMRQAGQQMGQHIDPITGLPTDMQMDPYTLMMRREAIERTGHDPLAGMTKMSGRQAVMGLGNLRSYAAQQVGQWMSNRWGPQQPIREFGPQSQAPSGGPQAAPQMPRPPAPSPESPSATRGPQARPEPPEETEAPRGVTTVKSLREDEQDYRPPTVRPVDLTEFDKPRYNVPPPPYADQPAAGGAGGGTGGGRGGGGAPPASPLPGGGGGRGPRPARNQTLSELGQRISRSGGATDDVMGALKKVPYVGLAIDVANKGADFYQEQREKNRAYQEIEGGTNAAGFGERASEEAYRWSHWGALSEETARKAFYGVTSLGYGGRSGDQGSQQNRMSALNFVQANYTNRGMDVNESLQVLQQVSRNATVSLRSVSTALKDVSDTAGQAGDNAKRMRQAFTQYLGAAITQGAGPGAPQLAGAVATMQASYGRAFQNTDFSQQFNQQNQYMLAAASGQNIGQVQQQMRTNPQEFSRLETGFQGDIVRNLPGMTDEAYADLQKMIQQYGGGNSIDASKANSIANDWLAKWQGQNSIDLQVWADIISAQNGPSLDMNNVMQWVVQQVAGKGQAAYAKQQADQNSMKPVNANNTGQTPVGQYGLAKGPSQKTGKVGPKNNYGAPAPDNGDATWQHTLKTSQVGTGWAGFAHIITAGVYEQHNNAANAYLTNEKKSGQRDPVLESLIQNVKDPNNTHVKVSTKAGQRVVTFAEAVRDFPNELASGQATFVDGDQAGKTTQDITGNEDPTRNVKGEQTNAKLGKQGVSAQQWNKQHPSQGNKTGQVQAVKVDLSAEAKKLLVLLPNNNNDPASTGQPPQNNNNQGSPPGRSGG